MIKESYYDSALRLLAYNGDSNAQYNIAKYYETDSIDIEQSIFWYKKAALEAECYVCISYGGEAALRRAQEVTGDDTTS